MRRLLALAAVSATLAVAPTHALAYTRGCGGIVDAECHGWTCHTDCFQGDCLVWVDALHNPATALCVGSLAD